MPHEILAPWHDFFSLVGTAAATLVGLMFVAATIGTGVFTEDRQVGLRTFLSPTVVAFSVVLATSLIGVLPARSWLFPSGLLLAMGLLGVIYALRVWHHMVREGISKAVDLEDRAWYIVVPATAYALLAAAGAGFLLAPDPSSALLAFAVCLLLLAGIRNAWDMTTWVVLRRRG